MRLAERRRAALLARFPLLAALEEACDVRHKCVNDDTLDGHGRQSAIGGDAHDESDNSLALGRTELCRLAIAALILVFCVY